MTGFADLRGNVPGKDRNLRVVGMVDNDELAECVPLSTHVVVHNEAYTTCSEQCTMGSP